VARRRLRLCRGKQGAREKIFDRWESGARAPLDGLIDSTETGRLEYDEASSIDNKGWMGVE
jgi:hypothetical protein